MSKWKNAQDYGLNIILTNHPVTLDQPHGMLPFLVLGFRKCPKDSRIIPIMRTCLLRLKIPSPTTPLIASGDSSQAIRHSTGKHSKSNKDENKIIVLLTPARWGSVRPHEPTKKIAMLNIGYIR
jgi:hypothetical protein